MAKNYQLPSNRKWIEHMRKHLFIISLIFFTACNADSLSISVQNSQKHEKAHIVLAMIGTPSAPLEQIADLVKKALEFTNQCAVTIFFTPHIVSKQEALAFKTKGYNYILFVSEEPQSIAWHLFDLDEEQMKKNKKVYKKGLALRGWAYALADSIYEALTSEPGFFSSKIAYGKQIPLKNGSHYTHLYIADYDGSNPECIVATPTSNTGPRWNKDTKRPLLFYSENTNQNMRLMAVDLHKKKMIAASFDGLNMLPAFSPDGLGVVFCSTRGDNNCQLYHWSHKKLQKITQNTGNNFAPVFGADTNTLYFSSDFESKYPQLYSCAIDTKHISRLTSDGYCVAPSFCARTNTIAYSKMVNGVMQLFSYDCGKKEHVQLTFDKAQKEECVWSECGTYLLCSVESGKTSRIALFNTKVGAYHYLTNADEYCCYPTWSAVYNEYPVLT